MLGESLGVACVLAVLGWAAWTVADVVIRVTAKFDRWIRR
jgi:hypothetical protein